MKTYKNQLQTSVLPVMLGSQEFDV
jgi:hypothetical protein